MGFAPKWVERIMNCISSISYSVAINGSIEERFRPSRGLRFKTRDPLSPFLFLLYGKGLSSLMRLAMQERRLKGVKASRSGPTILHLLFANDCILFGEANNLGCKCI